MNTIIRVLTSLRTTNILTGLLIILLVAGAFIMPTNPSYRTINQMGLFMWLKGAPLSATWWLYGSMAVLVLLVINTLACSAESLIKKQSGRNLLLVISPQIIHIGFCFIMLAHLISSASAFHLYGVLYQGAVAVLPDGQQIRLDRINYETSQGYIVWMEAELGVKDRSGIDRVLKIAPNKPGLISGVGVYLKQISLNPVPRALIEVSYEPGAKWALVGGLLFALGTVLLVILKLIIER
ncbi:MAG: cytochrome C biogenesis protein ResB [Nitrospirae bacterium]|nr:cytochrome C biogenesis protein ResB [Nitrospirota bacterium]